MNYPKVAQFKTVAALQQRLAELGIELPIDDAVLTLQDDSPLAEPLNIGGFEVGNRWCIHPMEGWDAQPDGLPSEDTLRRWRNFGLSGAKLIWGGEAAAVQADGRANPRQLMATPSHESGLRQLFNRLVEEHLENFETADDLFLGLQLTHSGRFARPHDKRLEPRIAYHHPVLDAKFGINPHDQSVVWTDDDLERLIDAYVDAAGVAAKAGFHFVDVKACHGYLLHEFLSARSRPGRFGGDFAGRTRLMTEIIGRIRDAYPELMVGVRLSVFDFVPYGATAEVGEPLPHETPYDYGFGVNRLDPTQYDLAEPIQLLQHLQAIGVVAVNLSCGSPYYNPHIQRPAIFPPSDGYLPPEDPLVGVARQIEVVRLCKQTVPEMTMVGTGYSYLQDYLPHVAQAVVRQGWVDAVGLGRMVLSYWDLPADTLSGRTVARKRLCRTFSDCTTAPRHGIISGCYPLDPYYKELPEAETVKQVKNSLKAASK